MLVPTAVLCLNSCRDVMIVDLNLVVVLLLLLCLPCVAPLTQDLGALMLIICGDCVDVAWLVCTYGFEILFSSILMHC